MNLECAFGRGDRNAGDGLNGGDSEDVGQMMTKLAHRWMVLLTKATMMMTTAMMMPGAMVVICFVTSSRM